MGYWITGPNYVAPPPITHDEIDAANRALIKSHLQGWIGLDGQEWSQDAVKEAKSFAKTLGLKIKNSDANAICVEIANEWVA
jgi:hypothetical protein